MGPQFNVDLDFTVASLAGLDDMLAKMIDLAEPYQSEQTSDLLPVALAVTAYVGEVFRQSIPETQWITEFQDGEMPPPHIRLKDGMRLNLMKKSLQILTRADSPSFAGYYQTVRELAQSRDAEQGGNA